MEGSDFVNDRQNKIIGSIMGGAVGDALGYHIEFTREIKDREYCKYFNDKGIISDDTQMTLFTANALIYWATRGNLRGICGQPTSMIYLAYLEWLETQIGKKDTDAEEESPLKITWIKEIKELNVQRSPGNTCISALRSGKEGTIEHPINNSKGCGGVMRVAPIGLYTFSAEESGRIAAEASALTHGHPLGIIPSYIFATMLYYIVNENENIYNSLMKAIKQYKEKYNIFKSEDSEYFFDLIKRTVELSKKDMSDVEAIKEIGEGWVAEEALAIALYSCLKYENSFEKTVICATNHDGDSDSTGAIAGNIIGAYLGYKAIPNYYVDNIELKDIIIEIATDLSSEVPVSEYKSDNDQYWLSKYLYCERNTKLKTENKESKNNDKVENEGMMIGDTICDFCIFKIENNNKICKKYLNGKPDKVLNDPYYYCPQHEMIELLANDIQENTVNDIENPLSEENLYLIKCKDCIYRNNDDHKKCKQYNNGKPRDILEEPFAFCELHKSEIDMKLENEVEKNQEEKYKIKFLNKIHRIREFNEFVNLMSEFPALDINDNEINKLFLKMCKKAISMAKEDKIPNRKIKKAEKYMKKIEEKIRDDESNK